MLHSDAFLAVLFVSLQSDRIFSHSQQTRGDHLIDKKFRQDFLENTDEIVVIHERVVHHVSCSPKQFVVIQPSKRLLLDYINGGSNIVPVFFFKIVII